MCQFSRKVTTRLKTNKTIKQSKELWSAHSTQSHEAQGNPNQLKTNLQTLLTSSVVCSCSVAATITMFTFLTVPNKCGTMFIVHVCHLTSIFRDRPIVEDASWRVRFFLRVWEREWGGKKKPYLSPGGCPSSHRTLLSCVEENLKDTREEGGGGVFFSSPSTLPGFL